ncbi:MAG: hypothetical protein NTV63_05260 [Candidatus Woesearchaeota archaeon]|nr:hypothetical protein [Candidatus Woesearchaeota archaeon]
MRKFRIKGFFGKKVGKKGFFFTVIAIYLIAVLVFSASFQKRYELRKEGQVLSSRIKSMNDFVKDVDKDLERGLYISGFRTLMGLEEYMSSRGFFLNDTNSAFQEAFFNKSIGNYSIALLEGSSFSDWAYRINSHAEEMNLKVNFTFNNLTISQSSPWQVDIRINVSMHIWDVSGLASWHREKMIFSGISIIDLEDPLYSVNTYGRVANSIHKAPSLDFVSGSDTSVLLNHLNNSYYVSSVFAPSFLMRLSGNLSASPYGIESLVDVSELTSQGITAKTKSVVDYIYFSSRVTNYVCVDNALANPDMPSWFRLDPDDSHASFYEISAINITC